MLPTLTPLIGIIARERTSTRPALYDDARQEGLIAAWRVSTTNPDASRPYVLASARNAVLGVVAGRPMTGEAGRRGWRDAATDADSLDYGDGIHDHAPDRDADVALDAVLDHIAPALRAELAHLDPALSNA